MSSGTRTCPPAVIEVPTGSGKTMAVLVPCLRPGAPRRLVYALPMCSLVEQPAQLAVEVFRHLEDGARCSRFVRSGRDVDVSVCARFRPEGALITDCRGVVLAEGTQGALAQSVWTS